MNVAVGIFRSVRSVNKKCVLNARPIAKFDDLCKVAETLTADDLGSDRDRFKRRSERGNGSSGIYGLFQV